MIQDRWPGLKLPIVVAPMFLISGPEMVIAACRAGVVGAFPTPNCRTTDELDAWMTQITAVITPGDVPWAANLVTHSSNPRLADDLALVARHKPPIVITALGSPRPAIEIVHGYGGIVLADVVTVTLARKAVAAGADGVVCVCAGAGGHTGQLSPFAFVAAIRQFFDGIVCVGGGIADGAAVAAAVIAGADLVYMGTRFIAAQESRAVDDYKAMILTSQLDDLIVSAAITGTAASWLKPSLRGAGYDPDALGTASPRDYGGDVAKRWKDVWAAGQGLHAITAIEPVDQIVRQLSAEFRESIEQLTKVAASYGALS